MAPALSTVTVMAFCCSGGVVCTVRGRFTWMALVSAGMVITNATSSTSMTSTSGVMLISLSTSESSDVETAMIFSLALVLLRADNHGLQPVWFVRAVRRVWPAIAGHPDFQRRVLREVQEVVGEIVVVRAHRFHASHEVVVGQHRRNRHRDADAGGDQRLADGAGHHVDRRVADAADVLHRRHDSPHGAEQS